MQAIDNFLSDQFIYAIGWTIIHSLWQASFIALLMSFYLKKYQDEPSTVRYRISITSLYILLGVSIATFSFYFFKGDATTSLIVYTNETLSTLTNANTNFDLLAKTNSYLNQNFGLITTMWISGMILFSLKFVGGLLWVSNIKKSARPVQNTSAHIILNDLMDKMGIQKVVRLAESVKASTPMMIGHMKPIILLPIGIINQLELHEVEAILAHELSHISRNDFLQNLIQSIVEVLYYYHPAVWWISANVRAERESCCDETAVKMCGNAIHYAKTLVKVEELQQQGIPALAIALARSKNNLLNRINRILQQPQTKTHIKEKLMATVLLFSFFTVFAGQSPIQHRVLLNTSESEFEEEWEEEIALEEEVETNPYYILIEKDELPEQELEVFESKIEAEDKISGIQQIIVEVDDTKIVLDTIPGQSQEETQSPLKKESVKTLRLKINNGLLEELEVDGAEIEETDIIIKLDGDGMFADIVEGQVEIKKLADIFESSPLKSYSHLFDKDKSDYAHVHPQQLYDQLKNNDLINKTFKNELWNNKTDFPNLENHFEFHSMDLADIGPNSLSGVYQFEGNIFGKPSDKIFYALYRDQLIERGDENSIELSSSHMKVNGEKQPTNIWKKYKKIYEKALGHELGDGSKIILKEQIRSKHSIFKHNG